MIILSLHILVATVMTLAIIGVFAAAYHQHETKAYGVMLGSFVPTILSGVGLLFVSVNGLGRLCVMMSAFTLVTLVARAYYLRRVILTSSL